MAANYRLQKQLKSLRVETGRRRRDPLATGFEDDSDDERERRSRSNSKQAPSVDKPLAPAKDILSPPQSTTASTNDTHGSDDDLLNPVRRTADRRPSPAPAQLPLSRVSDGAGRRGSVDRNLQGSLPGASTTRPQFNRQPRSAVAQAAGTLAYLDDSSDDEALSAPIRTDRNPSPAPRQKSDSASPVRRSSTPKGSREAPKELGQGAAHPSRNSVASPFAGTKYLQDSDSDEEAISSRKGSVEDTSDPSRSPEKQRHEVKRVNKPKQNGGGVSWRAFSEGRAEQRTQAITTLQTSLKQRGKSISFGSHALTDDGNRIPLQPTPEQILGGTGPRRKSRGKSPPRRAEDTKPAEEEMADGGPVGVYDPTQFKTNPFTGESRTSQVSDVEPQ